MLPAVGPAEQLELVGGLLKELSHGQAGERSLDERRGTLLELLKVAREDSLVVWEEHFKTMLLLLLETLGDKDVKTPHQPQQRRCRFRALLNVTPPLAAHHPSLGAAGHEGDPEEPAGPLQELRRAHHHEDAGGAQRLAQGGGAPPPPRRWGLGCFG